MSHAKNISVALLQAVEERDRKIEELRKKVDEATGALEENTALLDDVRTDLNKSKSVVGFPKIPRRYLLSRILSG